MSIKRNELDKVYAKMDFEQVSKMIEDMDNTDKVISEEEGRIAKIVIENKLKESKQRK